MLRLAAGLDPLQAGRIDIAGHTVAMGGAVKQVPPEKRGVGLMFQDYALFPHLTVLENTRFGISDGDRSRAEWVQLALKEMHLDHVAQRYPHTLSGGQQQRIALLRAIAPSPRVLLLDEPFSGLDEHLRHHIRQETLKMLTQTEVATLMVTHDPEEAMFLADRIVVLNHGRVAQDGTPVDTYRNPVDPFVARLFGPFNEFDGLVRDGRVLTPVGQVDAPGLSDGARALVMVRASGIDLVDKAAGGAAETGTGTGVAVRVLSARPLGPTSQILVEPAAAADDEPGGTGGIGKPVEARVSGLKLPALDTRLYLRTRPGHTFVFPRRSPLADELETDESPADR